MQIAVIKVDRQAVKDVTVDLATGATVADAIKHLVGQEIWENVDQGDQQDHLAQEGQKDRGFGVAQGDEGLLAGDLNAMEQRDRRSESEC